MRTSPPRSNSVRGNKVSRRKPKKEKSGSKMHKSASSPEQLVEAGMSDDDGEGENTQSRYAGK